MTHSDDTSTLFNFITSEDFRASLEADHKELLSCLKVGAWKAVHVLAGSIVEAVLVDYLQAVGYSKADPLKMDLSQAIDACKLEKVLSDKAATLSTVIRTYRNLIHPGRLVRLNETVDQDGAAVAHALVNMIVRDVSELRKKTYGYTAEQILAKVLHDHSSATILGDLLKRVHDAEKKKLLLKVLPERYAEGDGLNREDYARIGNLYRSILDTSPLALQEEAARTYAKVLKEEGSWMIGMYEQAFFRAGDLQHLPYDDSELVKKHLISEIGNMGSFEVLEGIGARLHGKEEVEAFVSALINVRLFNSDKGRGDRIDHIVTAECRSMTESSRMLTLSYLVERLRSYGDEEGIEWLTDSLKRLKEAIEQGVVLEAIPF